jgi:hypothetical protein
MEKNDRKGEIKWKHTYRHAGEDPFGYGCIVEPDQKWIPTPPDTSTYISTGSLRSIKSTFLDQYLSCYYLRGVESFQSTIISDRVMAPAPSSLRFVHEKILSDNQHAGFTSKPLLKPSSDRGFLTNIVHRLGLPGPGQAPCKPPTLPRTTLSQRSRLSFLVLCLLSG